MFYVHEFQKEFYKIKEIASLLNKSKVTIFNYGNQGKIKITKLNDKFSIVMKEDLLKYLESNDLLYKNKILKDKIIFLISSESEVIEMLNKLSIDKNLEIINSVIENERFKLISSITDNSVKALYIYSEDLLSVEFFNLIKNLCRINSTEINIFKRKEDVQK